MKPTLRPVKPFGRAQREATTHTRPELAQEHLDILALLRAAGSFGITPEGIVSQASAARMVISIETVEAALRAAMRLGLATMRGEEKPRWFITEKGAAS